MMFSVFQKIHVFGISATIRIGWESLCLPYAGFKKKTLCRDRGGGVNQVVQVWSRFLSIYWVNYGTLSEKGGVVDLFYVQNLLKKDLFSKTWPSWPSLFRSRIVRLCVCVSVHFLSVPFKRPFAPTFQNPMSKMFRDLESLGKSNTKIGFQIWTLLLIKGVKLPQRKKFFPSNFFGFSQKT